MEMIQKTTNYDVFKLLMGNRHLIKSHVQKFIKLLGNPKTNLFSSNPMKVNENFEVIDGQHRLEAAKQLGIPVYYFVTSGGLQEAIITNSTVKIWGLQSFVDSYVDQGSLDYQILDDFCKKYSLSISIGLEILNSRGKEWKISDRLKSGNFKIADCDLKRAEIIGQRILELKPYIDLGVHNTRDFVRAIKDTYRIKEFRYSEFLKKVSLRNERIHREGSRIQYLRLFEDIYNFRRQNRIRLS